MGLPEYSDRHFSNSIEVRTTWARLRRYWASSPAHYFVLRASEKGISRGVLLFPGIGERLPGSGLACAAAALPYEGVSQPADATRNKFLQII